MPRGYNRTNEHNERKFTFKCLKCKKKFNASRRDARYCSPTCRSAAAKERLAHWYQQVQQDSAIYEVSQGLSPDAIRKWLAGEI